MTLRLIEGATTALVDYFTANFSSKVMAINSFHDDDIILEDMAFIDDVEQIELEAHQYPHTELIGIRTDIVNETQFSVTSLHNIAVICTMMDDVSRRELRIKGYRYGVAILELLKAARSNAGLSGYTIKSISPIDFGPLRWSRDKSKVIANIIVVVQVSATEIF